MCFTFLCDMCLCFCVQRYEESVMRCHVQSQEHAQEVTSSLTFGGREVRSLFFLCHELYVCGLLRVTSLFVYVNNEFYVSSL